MHRLALFAPSGKSIKASQLLFSFAPKNNLEAINRYARHLIDRGHSGKAAELIGSALTPEQRLRHVLPAYLWREALRNAGEDTTPADEEIRIIEARRGRDAS